MKLVSENKKLNKYRTKNIHIGVLVFNMILLLVGLMIRNYLIIGFFAAFTMFSLALIAQYFNDRRIIEDNNLVDELSKLDNEYEVYIKPNIRYRYYQNNCDAIVVKKNEIIIINYYNFKGNVVGDINSRYWYENNVPIDNPYLVMKKQKHLIKNSLNDDFKVVRFLNVFYPKVPVNIRNKETLRRFDWLVENLKQKNNNQTVSKEKLKKLVNKIISE